MSRCSSMSFFATIFLLVNLILVSSAIRSYNVDELSKKTLQLTEDNIVSPDESTRLAPVSEFIGDLVIGKRRAYDVLYYDSLEIVNPSINVSTTSFHYTVKNGVIHYVSIINEPGSYAAVCDLPYSLGTSESYFNARVIPDSKTKLSIFVAAH